MQKYHIVLVGVGEFDSCDTLKRAYILAEQYARICEETIDIFLTLGNNDLFIDSVDYQEL